MTDMLKYAKNPENFQVLGVQAFFRFEIKH